MSSEFVHVKFEESAGTVLYVEAPDSPRDAPVTIKGENSWMRQPKIQAVVILQSQKASNRGVNSNE
jgi:hypothetical protein